MVGPVDGTGDLPPQGPLGDDPPDALHNVMSELWISISQMYSDGKTPDHWNMSNAMISISDFMAYAKAHAGKLDGPTQAIYYALTQPIPGCGFSFADIAKEYNYDAAPYDQVLEAFTKFSYQDTGEQTSPLNQLSTSINSWFTAEGNPPYNPHPGDITQNQINDLLDNLRNWELIPDKKSSNAMTYLHNLEKGISTLMNQLDKQHASGTIDGYMKQLYNLFISPVNDTMNLLINDVQDDKTFSQDLTTMLTNKDEFKNIMNLILDYEF